MIKIIKQNSKLLPERMMPNMLHHYWCDNLLILVGVKESSLIHVCGYNLAPAPIFVLMAE